MYAKYKKIYIKEDYDFYESFKKKFPELEKVSSEELQNRFYELGVYLYQKERIYTSFWLRLTMPFAFILMVLMYILSPINYFITGSFYYDLKEDNILLKWFRVVNLIK